MKQKQIENWLKIGFTSSADRRQEIFYFDKRDLQFFSILVTDYFLFDENFNVNEDTTASYSANSLVLLADRMQRIEHNDNTILALPRFGELEDEEQLQGKIDSFINLNAINIGNASIWEAEESGKITINITTEKQKPWWQFWG